MDCLPQTREFQVRATGRRACGPVALYVTRVLRLSPARRACAVQTSPGVSLRCDRTKTRRHVRGAAQSAVTLRAARDLPNKNIIIMVCCGPEPSTSTSTPCSAPSNSSPQCPQTSGSPSALGDSLSSVTCKDDQIPRPGGRFGARGCMSLGPANSKTDDQRPALRASEGPVQPRLTTPTMSVTPKAPDAHPGAGTVHGAQDGGGANSSAVHLFGGCENRRIIGVCTREGERTKGRVQTPPGVILVAADARNAFISPRHMAAERLGPTPSDCTLGERHTLGMGKKWQVATKAPPTLLVLTRACPNTATPCFRNFAP